MMGKRWTYRIDDEGIVGTKETVVGEMEVVGNGTKQGRAGAQDRHAEAVAERDDGQLADRGGDTVIRFREQSFRASIGTLEREDHWDPYKLHVDGSAARRVAGAHLD